MWSHTYFYFTRTYGIPIFLSSVWRDPIQIQCCTYFLIRPSIAPYSSRCNSNKNSLDTLPLMLLYSYLIDTGDSHYSNQFLISPNTPFYLRFKRHHPDGSVRNIKALFYARNYRQIEGVNFFHTFSPLINWDTVSIITIL